MNNNVEISLLDDTELLFEADFIKNNSLKIIEILSNMPEIIENSAIFEYENATLNFELSFCDDQTIHQINREYRQKDRPTDVITFALFADDPNSIVFDNTIELGEIIISNDTLLKQAKENNNTNEVELFTLITHGILHLLGFDHLTQKDYDFVVGVQNKVLAKL